MIFFGRRPVPFGGSRLTRLPRHNRSPVAGGIDPRLDSPRPAASCLDMVVRRASYHHSTRSAMSEKVSVSGSERVSDVSESE